MSNVLYVCLGVGAGAIIIVVVVTLLRNKKKRSKNPIALRAENMIVMLNQRILSINSRIDVLDKQITTLLAAEEKEDLSLLKEGIDLNSIPSQVELVKNDINSYIADIKDLKEYKEELESFLNVKGEKDWKKLEELLEFVKEKFQYRYT
ncbi:hypothetical protein EU534_00910 [Candidatus Heimdallarchaeota archaeon]|nr:MAG: hypothetical protein EU534_00910 [Candidatus Heimdallarchaeota archaeon]